ncbi:neogenin isoform X1 [Neodiprion pinetum]|uniref:neogenin isoform X1 n=1 Tax=Neodiprion pinetum TaxID=441929 RepID=UPI001EDF5B5E|nr:neogenin isoform X2 [Neodiprion pinetum]
MELRVALISLALLTFVGQAIGRHGLQLLVEPQDVVVEQGAEARLDCVPNQSLGTPTIQWRTDDGQPISFIGDSYRSQLENGSLYISSVYAGNPELTGGYQCLASIDEVGAIVSRIATIRLASLPGFEREPQDTMVYPGQVAYLSCVLPLSASPLKIQWLKDEHPFSLDESRMTILPSGALEIDHAQPQDVGSYRCNASGIGQHRLSNKAQLNLLTSDIDQGLTAPVFVAKPSEHVAIEGTTITLECAANGNPKPTILWLKDGIAVDLAPLDSRYRKVAASSLMITDIKEIDHGSYQCRAENVVDALDAVADVTVQVPPRFIKKPEDRIANEDQDLELECEIYGKPEPKVTWLKNGEKITPSAYWQLVNGYNLRINGLLQLDAGIFQCIGVNPAGSVQASARLFINQPRKVEKRKPSNPKHPPKKNLHRQLYNNTWQHPDTLLGETLSAYTPNSEISISPSDDPADILGIISNPKFPLIPEPNFIDETDTLDLIEGSAPSAPRDLNAVLISTRFVTLRWREPENINGDIQTYHVYYKQEGSPRERVVNTSQNRLEGVIQGLQPSTKYQFRVVARNERGVGASSAILHVTTQSEADVPGPPLNLLGQAISSNSIDLTWEEPYVTNGRVIKYLITYIEGESEGKTNETVETRYRLLNLTPFTEYNFWVQAVNENGPGASTNEITVRTLSAPPTQSPYNVTLEAANSTSIIIRWEPPLEGKNGVITGYQIRYRQKGRKHWTPTTTQGNQKMYQLNGLEKHVIYQLKICALNVNGTGPWSDVMDIEPYERDLDESKVPNSPTNLKTKPMSDSIFVSWSPPKDQNIKVRGYTLGWGKGFPDNYTKKLDSKQRYFTIESLEPLAEYVIALRATNAVGEGTPSYANVQTTARSVTESVAPLIPPVGLKAVVLSASTMMVYWTDSTLSKSQYVTDKRYYVVRYTSHHHSSNPRYKYYNSTDLNCMIVDLKPNTQYEFTVKLVKGKRESPWSMVELNTTQEAAPSSPPRDLTVQSVEDHATAVMLHWLPPKQPNAPITGYIISYTTDNTKWDRDWRVEAIIGDQSEIMIKTLQPSTTYYFKIKARNARGYGPFSSSVAFKTPESTPTDGRLSSLMICIIVGLSVVVITGVAVIVVVMCCRRRPESPDHKKGYTKDSNQKTNIKPPDLWIHHDQMELKAPEKSSINGEACSSGVGSNTLPRSGNQDYNQENMHINSSSLDKRTYVPSYMGNNDEKCSTLTRQHNRGSHKPKLITLPVDTLSPHQPIATATPIVNSSISQPAIHNSCADVPSVRPNYPRTAAQYSLSRAHVTLEPTPESSPDSCSMPSTYEPLQTQIPYPPGNQHYGANSQYTSGVYGSSSQPNSTVGVIENVNAKRLQGHPLKSFSVPAPPPQSAPSTPAQQKHGVSQVTVRPTISGSPYKKPPITTTQITKNRLATVVNPTHTAEEVERLKPSYSTEELNQEMANLEGLMKDLNAITASEFEC